MGYESEIHMVEYDIHSQVVFENGRLLFYNDSESDDEEFQEIYEELMEETQCEVVERNYYAEALEDPVRKRYRHMPWIWAREMMERM
jgi:hypothetical protein